MTFTKDIPTTTGFYAHRRNEKDAIRLLVINDETLSFIHSWPDCEKGEWCRLVPAEELEKAWEEALRTWNPWKDSRAKRVMEGRE